MACIGTAVDYVAVRPFVRPSVRLSVGLKRSHEKAMERRLMTRRGPTPRYTRFLVVGTASLLPHCCASCLFTQRKQPNLLLSPLGSRQLGIRKLLLKYSDKTHSIFLKTRPQSYEQFTSLYLQACEYKSFLKSIVVTTIVKFN